MSNNDLQKRNPIRNMQMALNTACAMGTAAMMSTMFAYADVTSAINKVFNVGNSVANAISKGLTNIVVPIGIAVFLYFLVRMLLSSDPKDVQMYKKRLITTAIIVVIAAAVPGLIKVFVFEADAEKMKDNAAAYQEELNKEFNNTPKIEKALRRELWRHVLLERCRQKGLITADLAGLDIIQIIQVHDAFVKSGLLEELIEEREAYLQKNDLNQIDDKFLLYKRAVRDRIVKPEKDEVSGSELALMADCVQDLFNARADSDYMSGRIKTVMFCRRPGFAAEKSPAGVFDAFMRICSEHDIGGKTVNFLFKQSKEDHISQSTIETLKQLNRNLFARRDEEAVAAYFRYDKADLQETLDQVKSSILKFYQNKEYLK